MANKYISLDDAIAVAMYSKDIVEGIKMLPYVEGDDVKAHGKWVKSADMTHHCSVCNE